MADGRALSGQRKAFSRPGRAHREAHAIAVNVLEDLDLSIGCAYPTRVTQNQESGHSIARGPFRPVR
jgi:hypothetical protein